MHKYIKKSQNTTPCLALHSCVCGYVCVCMCVDNRCFACRFYRGVRWIERDEEDRICLTSISGHRRVEQRVKMDREFPAKPIIYFVWVRVCACMCVCGEEQ